MVTREELEDAVNRAIAAAKIGMEEAGDFQPVVQTHYKDEWQSFPLPGAALSNGIAKDMLFGAIRETVKTKGIDAVLFCTDSWMAELTEEGQKHYETPEWKKLHEFGFEKLVQRGWVERFEAIMVTAQNPEGALVVQQKYQRRESGAVQLLESKRNWFDQANFTGRQKMFGDLRFENLGSEAAVKGKTTA